jgi:hypothetical protein
MHLIFRQTDKKKEKMHDISPVCCFALIWKFLNLGQFVASIGDAFGVLKLGTYLENIITNEYKTVLNN